VCIFVYVLSLEFLINNCSNTFYEERRCYWLLLF